MLSFVRSFVRLPLALIRSKERYRFSLSLPRCCRESWEIELATTTCTHSALSSPKWIVVLLLLRWIIIIAIIFAPSPLTLKSVGRSVGRSVGGLLFIRSFDSPVCYYALWHWIEELRVEFRSRLSGISGLLTSEGEEVCVRKRR